MLREQGGFAQEKFAFMIEMDRSFYGMVEGGERNISFLNLAKIAKGLGLPLEEVVKGIKN